MANFFDSLQNAIGSLLGGVRDLFSVPKSNGGAQSSGGGQSSSGGKPYEGNKSSGRSQSVPPESAPEDASASSEQTYSDEQDSTQEELDERRDNQKLSFSDIWNFWKNTLQSQSQSEKWFGGEVATDGEIQARIHDIAQTDREGAEQLFNEYQTLKETPGNPLYNPYNKGSTIQGAKDFFGVEEFTDTFFRENEWMLEHLPVSSATGDVLEPGKQAPELQQAAYWYNRALGARETTKAVHAEWSAMQKDIEWYVAAGYDDADIRAKLARDSGNYKNLNKLFEAASTGTAVQLTEGIGYSPDAITGVLGAVRNGNAVGDPKKDYSVETVRYYRSKDHGKAKLRDPQDDPASDAYAPYRRATSGALRELGMHSLDEEDLDKLTYLKGDPESQLLFEQIH